MFSEVHHRVKKAGMPPGTAHYTGDKNIVQPVITIVAYNAQEAIEKTCASLKECLDIMRPDYVVWINVEGLQDLSVINDLAKTFNLHPLTIEDILNVEQRPKVEEFDNYTFITLKVLLWEKKAADFNISQLSLVIGKDFILSFQEQDTTRFDEIRKRIQVSSNQRLREQGSDYLAYRMIDNVIDEYFFVLEGIGNKIEIIEQRIVAEPKPQNARSIYRLKQKLILLRKAVWPMREAINHLLYTENNFITKFTRIYLRDVYDHTMQAIDTVETFRDMLSSMLDMYLSALTIRMNEIMKTLTIITTIFIPITALASIYGMNIENIPFSKSARAFEIVFTLMLLIAVLMILYFKRKKWF